MQYGHSGDGFWYFLCALITIIILIDLILFGMWLWKKIQREDRKLQKFGCDHTKTCDCEDGSCKLEHKTTE